MEQTEPTKTRALGWLALIVVMAFALRWPVAERLLPELPEPDAFQVLHAQEWKHDPALVQHWEYAQRYPKLLTYAFAAFPVRTPEPGLSGSPRVEDALACAAAPYRRARVIVLILSLLALPLTWLVASRFAGSRGALIATWLVATSLLHALFSTQGRPHGVHLTASLWAVWAALRLVERPTWARTAVAMLAAAIAMATLQNGVFTLAPLALAVWFRPGSRALRWATAGIVPLVAAALAFTVYPALPSIDKSGIHLGGALSHNVFFSDFTFQGMFVAARWFFGHDPVLCVMAVVGLLFMLPWLARNFVALIRGAHPLVAVVLAYVVPYSILMLVSQDIYERFLLPLLPWCAILAVRPLARFCDRPAETKLVIPVRAIIAAVLALPLVVLGRFAWVSLQPGTLQQAASWIEHDEGSRARHIVVTPSLSLPLLLTPAALEQARGDSAFESRVWFAWQLAHGGAPDGWTLRALPGSIAVAGDGVARVDAWLAEHRPDYVVSEVSRKMTMLPALNHLREWTATHGELVHRSRGVAPDRLELGLADYQGIESFAQRLFGMSAFGPEIEIWRITR